MSNPALSKTAEKAGYKFIQVTWTGNYANYQPVQTIVNPDNAWNNRNHRRSRQRGWH